MKRTTATLAVTLALAILVSGCSTASQLAALGMPANYARSPVFDSQPIWRAVVIPPQSVSASSEADLGDLTDYAGMALLRTGRFTLIDRTMLDQLLSEQELSYSGVVDQATAVRLGGLLGAEAVVTINIGQITHDSFWDDDPMQRDAVLHLKIVSVETSEVLYTSSGEGSSFEGAQDALKMALEVSLIGLVQQ